MLNEVKSLEERKEWLVALGKQKGYITYEQLADELKGLDVCPNCKEHVNADVVFCPKCGTKMEEEIIDVEETEDIFEEVVEEVKEIVEEVVEEIKED